MKKRVLIVTNELRPYVELSDVAEAISNLPGYLNTQGYEIRILMPRFGTINERRHRLHEVVRLSGMNIIMDDEDFPLIIKVASLPNSRLQVYFLDNEEFFKRKNIFSDDAERFHDDNAERMVFFCKGVCETVKKFGWAPDIIHCNGWMTSLVPVYARTVYKDEPVFENAKLIYSLYNTSFDGKLGANFLKKAKIAGDINEKDLKPLEGRDFVSLSLGGAHFSDAIIMGSKNIDKSINDKYKTKNGKAVLKFNDKEDYLLEYLELYKKLHK